LGTLGHFFPCGWREERRRPQRGQTCRRPKEQGAWGGVGGLSRNFQMALPFYLAAYCFDSRLSPPSVRGITYMASASAFIVPTPRSPLSSFSLALNGGPAERHSLAGRAWFRDAHWMTALWDG